MNKPPPPFDERLAAKAYRIQSDPEKRLQREGAFLKRFIGKGTRVLDLACGTGVHAEFLARWGAVVTARDLSAAMIEEAELSHAHTNVDYAVGDMRTPPEGRFDLVLCIGNSLSMLPTRDGMGAVFAAVSERLAPGGRFLVHCINPESKAHTSPTVTVRSGSLEGETLTVVKTMAPLANGGRIVTLALTLGEGHPSLRGSRLLDPTQGELARRATDAGLSDLTWYGSLDGSSFVPGGSPDLVLLASAPDTR